MRAVRCRTITALAPGRLDARSACRSHLHYVSKRAGGRVRVVGGIYIVTAALYDYEDSSIGIIVRSIYKSFRQVLSAWRSSTHRRLRTASPWCSLRALKFCNGTAFVLVSRSLIRMVPCTHRRSSQAIRSAAHPLAQLSAFSKVTCTTV